VLEELIFFDDKFKYFINSITLTVWANGGQTVGLGHLLRCRQLARRLPVNQVQWLLPADLIPGESAKSPLPDWPGTCHPIRSVADGMNHLAQNPPDWVLLDHYDLDHTLEARISALGCRLLVIDDLPHRPHACDLLLDSNLHTRSTYGRHTLQGLHMALLPSPAKAALAHSYRNPSSLLICFGGSDPTEHTTQVLPVVLAQLPNSWQLTVVCGPLNTQFQALQSHYAGRVTLLQNPPDLYEQLARHTFYLGAGGSMALEALQHGCFALVMPVASNQAPAQMALQACGHGKWIPTVDDLSNVLQRIVPPFDPSITRESAMTLFDGHGVSRVLRAMHALSPA
jgi:UDP-2,4-diacetamido-2,4,6-trideoxy-beta-L-altropyranose hydrolase